jgi:purine nucleosidase
LCLLLYVYYRKKISIRRSISINLVTIISYIITYPGTPFNFSPRACYNLALFTRIVGLMKVHLDTDIGGDIDDVCALALLLKWPDLEITGITTVAEAQGRRAGYVDYMLRLMKRTDIPFAAGADVADGYYRYNELGYPPDEDNWPEPVPPRPNAFDEALLLLKRSIEQGAMLIGIGPFTNLMLLDKKYPGILKQAKLVLMGGYVYDIPPGFPQWSNSDDWNVQVDIRAAQYVLEYASPLLVPVTVSCQTALRRAYLPRLSQAGPLGQLIVRQAEAFAWAEPNQRKYGETCPGLPRDIINFQHDPLACAIALGWGEGVTIESVPLKLEVRDTWLYETPHPDGIPIRLVTKVDGSAFNEFWYNLLCQ